MKKYFLTALLGAFACIGFASADTVWNFTSDSTIYKENFSDSSPYWNMWNIGPNINNLDYYACVVSSDFPYYLSYAEGTPVYVDTSYYCYNNALDYWDSDFWFTTDWVMNWETDKSVSWFVYYSLSPISYSSSGWSSGWSSSSSTPLLNSTWQAYLWNVLSWIQSVVSEFVPYMIYIALWILVVTLWFIAVKWLMNYAWNKVTSIFKSKRR